MSWSAGYTGPIRITTRLEDEREIDIDDRNAKLIIELELAETVPFGMEARNLQVTLHFDFTGTPDPAISFGGQSKGPYELIKKSNNVTLRPGETVVRDVTVTTGAFSRKPYSVDTASATPGRREIDAEVSYELAATRAPGAKLIERDATLQFVVARD